MAAKKYLAMIAGVISEVAATVVSAGSGDDGKLVALNAAGQLDTSVMPTGIGADTQSVLASEAIAAGSLVNVYNNAGTAGVRKADATTSGKPAHGFVLSAVALGAAATVYFEGNDTALTGLTPGPQWLSATTPGQTTTTPPSASGNAIQQVGFATSPTNMNFQSGPIIVLA